MIMIIYLVQSSEGLRQLIVVLYTLAVEVADLCACLTYLCL